MKKINLTLILLIGILFSNLANARAAKNDEPATSARAFVETLAKKDFSAAVKNFGPPLKDSLPSKDLQETWESILSKKGSFQNITGIEAGKAEEYGGRSYQVVIVNCQFERERMNVRISFDGDSKITSLWFVSPDKK